MKKDRSKMSRIVAFILAGLMIFSALFSALMSMGVFHVHAHAETVDTQYSISAQMLPDEQILRCEQTIVYTNGTDEKLSQLFFSCYLNALRRQETLPFDGNDIAEAYPQGFAPGGVQFYAVMVDGEAASWGVQGEDETFLRVAVDLEPGQSVEIFLQYDLLLPVCSGFAGAGAFDWRLTNAFPAVCPYENGAFRTNGVLAAGRFAFADAADWQLQLTAPEGYILASGGVGSMEKTENGLVKWTRSIENARDMAIAIGRRYTVYASENDGRIAVYANDSAAAKAALETAEKAMALYENRFGPYPWDSLDIVMSQFAQGLRSAPGLVLLNKEQFALAERDELEYSVAFALAQQFFGEAVGVDPYDEPWLTEGVAGLCAMLYYRETYGEERLLEEMRARVEPALNVTIPGGVRADSSAAYFNSRAEYETVLRGRGTAALYELMLAMGREEMPAALRIYYGQNCFGEGTIESFVGACNAAAGGEWGRFLTEMLASIGTDARQTEWY